MKAESTIKGQGRKAPPVWRTGRLRRLASLVSDQKSDWQAEKQENLPLEQIIPSPDRQMGGAKIGQTTLEALIALAIFVVTITTVATVYFGSQSAVVDARLNNQALYLAREDLEEARATARDDFDSLVSSETTSGLYTREIIVEDLSAYNKRVTSRVSWEIDPLRPQEVALVTHITDWKSVVPIAGSCNLGPLSGNWAAPQVLGSGDLGAGNQGTDVVVSLPYAYVSGTASASAKPDIFVFDVSNPASPSLVASRDIGSRGINALSLKDNYLYAASSNDNKELIIFDISSPTNIAEVGSINLTGSAGGLSVSAFSNVAAIGRRENEGTELYFIDVTNHALPVLITSFEVGEDVNDLNATETRLYVASEADSGELGIFNISTPTIPNLITYHDIAGADDALSVAFQKPRYVFLGDEDDNFFILEMTDDFTPTIRSVFEVPGDGDIYDMVCVQGDLAFLATKESNQEFFIVNIDDFDNPVQYGFLNFPQVATGIDFAENKVFMSVRSNDALKIIGPGP